MKNDKLQNGDKVTLDTEFRVIEEWKPEEIVDDVDEPIVRLKYKTAEVRVSKSDISEITDQNE